MKGLILAHDKRQWAAWSLRVTTAVSLQRYTGTSAAEVDRGGSLEALSLGRGEFRAVTVALQDPL